MFNLCSKTGLIVFSECPCDSRCDYSLGPDHRDHSDRRDRYARSYPCSRCGLSTQPRHRDRRGTDRYSHRDLCNLSTRIRRYSKRCRRDSDRNDQHYPYDRRAPYQCNYFDYRYVQPHPDDHRVRRSLCGSQYQRDYHRDRNTAVLSDLQMRTG